MALGLIVVVAARADEEPFCTAIQPPPEEGTCQPNRLNIRFADGTSMLPLGCSPTSFTAKVTLDVDYTEDVGTPPVKRSGVSGVTYGVKHDPAYFAIPEASIADCNPHDPDNPTDTSKCNPTVWPSTALVQNAEVKGWNATGVAESKDGWYSSLIFDNASLAQIPAFAADGTTPTRDYVLCNVTYDVKTSQFNRSKIFFTETLNPPGSPKTTITLTTFGKSRKPNTVFNAIVDGAGGCGDLCPLSDDTTKDFTLFFGPRAGTSDLDCTGVTYPLTIPVTLRNKETVIAFQGGIKLTGGTLTFDGTLGTPAVDLSITVVKDGDPTEVSGDTVKGNRARGLDGKARITKLELGAALAAFHPGDFCSFCEAAYVHTDTEATFRYTSDVSGTGHLIPATPENGVTGACGGQEVMVLTAGGGPDPGFSRGDANGDGKINITDAVIVARNIFDKNFKRWFDCQKMLDVDDDGKLGAGDPVFLLEYLFLQGPRPAAPFGKCGMETNPDATTTCNMPNCQ